MQMTAYVVRIGDWSSDVCASDLCVSAGCAPERFGPSPVPYTMLRPRRGLVMIHAFRRSTTSAAALLLLLSVPVSAVAQGLNGRPGVDYYPPWMLDADPRVSGGGQAYRIWDDRRFDRRDEEFLEFQRRQRRDPGPAAGASPDDRPPERRAGTEVC